MFIRVITCSDCGNVDSFQAFSGLFVKVCLPRLTGFVVEERFPFFNKKLTKAEICINMLVSRQCRLSFYARSLICSISLHLNLKLFATFCLVVVFLLNFEIILILVSYAS